MENRQDCIKEYDDGIQKMVEDWDKQMELQNPLDNGDTPFELFEQDEQGNITTSLETPPLKVI